MASDTFVVVIDSYEEVFVDGSADRLRDFADALRDFAASWHDTRIGNRSFEGIRFTKSRQNTISAEDGRVTLAGTQQFFENLSSNIPWDVEDPSTGISYHIHYDRVSMGWLLSEKSMDMILTKVRDDI